MAQRRLGISPFARPFTQSSSTAQNSTHKPTTEETRRRRPVATPRPHRKSPDAVREAGIAIEPHHRGRWGRVRERKWPKGVGPCSNLPPLEAMDGGIDRSRRAKEVASAGSLDGGLRVLEDCDGRRRHALWQLEVTCKDGCRWGGGVWNDVVSRMNWRRRIKGRLGGGGGRER